MDLEISLPGRLPASFPEPVQDHNRQRVWMHASAAIDLAWLAGGKLDAIAMLADKPPSQTARRREVRSSF